MVELQKAITSDVADVTAQSSDNKSTEELWEIIRLIEICRKEIKIIPQIHERYV